MPNSPEGGTGDVHSPTTDRDTAWRQAAQRHFDPDANGELTTDIVFAIAAAVGVEPTELKSPPLYDIVDVAAIEDAFFGSGTPTRSGAGTVAFRYTDYRVTVNSDGWIQVYEPTETEHP